MIGVARSSQKISSLAPACLLCILSRNFAINQHHQYQRLPDLYPFRKKSSNNIIHFKHINTSGVSILMSYGENPHYVKLLIFSEFMENSAKFMKNSGLTKWTQNLR